MAFHEVRFPTDISYGSSGGPEFSTDIVITHSGYEQRNINWANARGRYNVAHGVKTNSQLKDLISFFRARVGKAYGFRFKDWTDYSASGEFIGTGNGVKTQFQLQRNYTSGNESVARSIKKPVNGTIKIYLNDVQQNSGWSADVTTGVVTFTSPVANSVVVTADYEFDVPVRFDTDRLSARLDDYGLNSWNDIPLIEIKL